MKNNYQYRTKHRDYRERIINQDRDYMLGISFAVAVSIAALWYVVAAILENMHY